jgi:hypothetical protein
MATLGAILRGIRGIHCHKLPAGPCCLVRKEGSELTPRGVANALGETMVMRHPVDRKVFNCDEIKDVDDTTAVLVGEVTAPPGDTLMDSRHHTASLGAFGRSLFFFCETTLRPGKRLFLLAEEARVGNLLSVAEGGKGFQPHVNADLLPYFWQHHVRGPRVSRSLRTAANCRELPRTPSRHEEEGLSPLPAGLPFRGIPNDGVAAEARWATSHPDRELRDWSSHPYRLGRFPRSGHLAIWPPSRLRRPSASGSSNGRLATTPRLSCRQKAERQVTQTPTGTAVGMDGGIAM